MNDTQRTDALRTLALFALQAIDGHAFYGVEVDENSDLARAAAWIRSGAARDLFGDLPAGDTFGEGAETGPVWLDEDNNAAHGDGYATATVDMVHDVWIDWDDETEMWSHLIERYGVAGATEYVRGYRDGRASYGRRLDALQANESDDAPEGDES